MASLVVVAGAAVAAAQPIDEPRLMSLVREIPSARAALGSDAERAGLHDAESWLTAKLRELGFEPRAEPVRWALPKQPVAPDAVPPAWNNIVVEVRGTERPREIVLVGAHLDAVPGAPGADDNASGVAGMLEIARVIREPAPKRTVRLVFFTLEEVGLVGSREHAKRWLEARSKAPEGERESIVAMLSLEMLGFYCDEPGCQKSPVARLEGVFEPPTVGDSIALVSVAPFQTLTRRLRDEMVRGEPACKVTLFDFAPVPIPDMLRSDHAPFLLAGIPAVMVTDTANFRNPNYHKPTDTAATLDGTRYARTVRALSAAVKAVADDVGGPAAPVQK